MKTVDELMRLHDDAKIAHTEWVMTGNGEMREDETRQALRSALEDVVREIQHLQMAANSEAQRGDELAADAKRYRWLRDANTDLDALAAANWEGGDVYSGEALDAAIDAAMQQAPEQEG